MIMSKRDQQDFRFLVEAANDIVGVISKDGKFLYINQRGYDLTGYGEEDLGTLSLLFHAGGPRRARARIPRREKCRSARTREVRDHDHQPRRPANPG